MPQVPEEVLRVPRAEYRAIFRHQPHRTTFEVMVVASTPASAEEAAWSVLRQHIRPVAQRRQWTLERLERCGNEDVA